MWNVEFEERCNFFTEVFFISRLYSFCYVDVLTAKIVIPITYVRTETQLITMALFFVILLESLSYYVTRGRRY